MINYDVFLTLHSCKQLSFKLVKYNHNLPNEEDGMFA